MKIKLSAIKCAKKGFINTAPDQIECALCKIPIKLEGNFSEFLTSEDTIKINNFIKLMENSHLNDDCPFKKMTMNDKTKLQLREKPQFYDYQIDYLDFTNTGIFLNWESNFTENYQSYNEIEQIPYINLEFITQYLQNTDLDLLWFNNDLTRKNEINAVSILALFGWKCEKQRDLPVLTCKYCLRKCAISIYELSTKIQQITNESRKCEKFIFDPVKAHFLYCSWMHKSEKHKNGPEITLDFLKSRLGITSKILKNAKIFSTSDPQKYIESHMKIAVQIKQLYNSGKLLKSQENLGEENKAEQINLKKNVMRLKDVDTLENEKFRLYIERRIKEAIEKNKEIQLKNQEINEIVSIKRKRVFGENYENKGEKRFKE